MSPSNEHGLSVTSEGTRDFFAESQFRIDRLFGRSSVSWDEVLERRRQGGVGPVPGREKVFYIGDIHGASPEALDDDLRRIGLLGGNRRWQNPQNRYLVQVGDLIDRGERGLEIYDRIHELQEQSEGRLIRLFGNHELYHLAGVPWQISARAIPGLQERLFRDILSGKVAAAFSEGNTIYTHAGIDLNFFPEFKGMETKQIVSELNRRFLVAVQKFHEAWTNAGEDGDRRYKASKEFLNSDPIFDPHNGIFWTRSNIANDQFQQVVGHTPQKQGIQDNPGDRVKYVDVGRIFGELGRFDLVNSRAIGANSATSQSMRIMAHDMRVFADFIKDGGRAFSDTSIAARLRHALNGENVLHISLARGQRVETSSLCDALQKLEQEQPEAVKVFVLKYFAGMSVDDLATSMPGHNRDEIGEMWQAASDWLYFELFPQARESLSTKSIRDHSLTIDSKIMLEEARHVGHSLGWNLLSFEALKSATDSEAVDLSKGWSVICLAPEPSFATALSAKRNEFEALGAKICVVTGQSPEVLEVAGHVGKVEIPLFSDKDSKFLDQLSLSQVPGIYFDPASRQNKSGTFHPQCTFIALDGQIKGATFPTTEADLLSDNASSRIEEMLSSLKQLQVDTRYR